MKLTVRHRGDIVIVDLSGRIAYGDGEGVLKEAVVALLGEGRRKLIINMSAVPFIDSSGIVELVGCHKRACEAGAEIRLLSLAPRVRELLDITQLVDLIPIFDDEDKARASLKRSGRSSRQ